jgi:hypothetical protein
MIKKLLVLGATCLALASGAAVPLTASAQSVDRATSPPLSEAHTAAYEVAAPAAFDAAPVVTGQRGPVEAPAALETSAARYDFAVTVQEGPHGGVGNNLAYVAVGVVGTVAGIKIGGGAGGTIAVASAALALYGLYRMLR